MMRGAKQAPGNAPCTFGLRLRASREHARMTVEDLARAGKVTVPRIRALEMGGSAPASPELAGRLAVTLQVNALWLLAGPLAGPQFKPTWYVGGGA